eukprot:g9875.t1
MEHRALRLPQAEPLLHVPISVIVEFVSNRNEAEVLLRVGDLAHEFDHLTASLVLWLEHQQYLRIDCQERLPALGSAQSLTSTLAPLTHQARAANRRGVRVLQQKISETVAQLQRHMDAVEVFSNQNASFSQELHLCGLRDRAEQRHRLAETESTLANRLSKFLGGCDSFYDEHPLPLAMKYAAGTASGGSAISGAARTAAAAPAAKPPAPPEPPVSASAPTIAPTAARTATATAASETTSQEAGRAHRTGDNPKHLAGGGGPNTLNEPPTDRKRPRPPLPAGDNVGPSSKHPCAGNEETSTLGDDRCRKQRRKHQHQQQQQQPSQGDEDNGNEDDGSFTAPSFLTPPLVRATPAVGGSGGGGNRAAPGLVTAPHSTCSSVGSTPSTGSSSPALAVASPAPTPKSSPRRSADGNSRGNSPGTGSGGGVDGVATEPTSWNACAGHGRKRGRIHSDSGGGRVGAAGLGEVTALSAAASAPVAAASVAAPLSDEQPHSSCDGSSPTPPSTREPSPPPLSTQEGSVFAAEGRSDRDDTDRPVGREEEEEEEESAAARDGGKGGVYGSFWPGQGGGTGRRTIAGGGDDAAAAAAAMAEHVLALAGAGDRAHGSKASTSGGGDGGAPGFVLRAPPPERRGGAEAPAPLREGWRDIGVEEKQNEEEEEEEDGDEKEDDDMVDTAETVEDSMIPAALAAPQGAADATAVEASASASAAAAAAAAGEAPCWGSQDGADEAGGAHAETGLVGGVGTSRDPVTGSCADT